jgi:predicted nucleic acid-binding protein
MTAAVLVDTGPLYALSDPSDQYHRRAREEMKRLEEEGLLVAVAYPTIGEAYTLVLRRLGSRYARGWLQNLLDGAILITPDADDYQKAFLRILKYPDQAITLFDALTAVLSDKLNQSVWTYDHHFDLMRVARWN